MPDSTRPPRGPYHPRVTAPQALRRLAAGLQRLHQTSGWTLRELAARSGVSHQTVARALDGRAEITVATAARLAAAMGVALRDLLPDEPEGIPEKSANPVNPNGGPRV